MESQQDCQVDKTAFVEWTFKYWQLILHLEMLVLIFVRSHREQNFDLYIEVLGFFCSGPPQLYLEGSSIYPGHEDNPQTI